MPATGQVVATASIGRPGDETAFCPRRVDSRNSFPPDPAGPAREPPLTPALGYRATRAECPKTSLLVLDHRHSQPVTTATGSKRDNPPIGTHTSALHAPSGLISQPVAARIPRAHIQPVDDHDLERSPARSVLLPQGFPEEEGVVAGGPPSFSYGFGESSASRGPTDPRSTTKGRRGPEPVVPLEIAVWNRSELDFQGFSRETGQRRCEAAGLADEAGIAVADGRGVVSGSEWLGHVKRVRGNGMAKRPGGSG